MSYVVFYVIYTKIQGTYILIEKNCFDKKVAWSFNKFVAFDWSTYYIYAAKKSQDHNRKI